MFAYYMAAFPGAGEVLNFRSRETNRLKRALVALYTWLYIRERGNGRENEREGESFVKDAAIQQHWGTRLWQRIRGLTAPTNSLSCQSTSPY